MKKFLRRKYIVDKGVFQTKFLLPFVGSWFLAAAVATVFFNYMVQRKIEKLLWKAHVTVATTDQIIGQIFFYTIGITSVLLFLLLALSCWFTRQKSNGVTIRMVKDLDAVAKGDFSKRIWLRKKDVFQEVATVLNGFIADKQSEYKRLIAGLEPLQATITHAPLAEAKQQLTATKLEQIKAILQGLRGDSE